MQSLHLRQGFPWYLYVLVRYTNIIYKVIETSFTLFSLQFEPKKQIAMPWEDSTIMEQKIEFICDWLSIENCLWASALLTHCYSCRFHWFQKKRKSQYFLNKFQLNDYYPLESQ
jgi:hypothetical protein